MYSSRPNVDLLKEAIDHCKDSHERKQVFIIEISQVAVANRVWLESELISTIANVWEDNFKRHQPPEHMAMFLWPLVTDIIDHDKVHEIIKENAHANWISEGF